MTENVDSVSSSSPKPRAPKPPTELSFGVGSAPIKPVGGKPIPGAVAKAASGEKKPAPSSFFADKIFGLNPFPEGDARRGQWETNASYAAEEFARLEGIIWRTLPPETATSEQFLAHALDSTSGCFDIWARRLLIFTVNGPASVVLYEECLTSIITRLLQKIPDKGRFGLSKQQFLLEINIRLKQRKGHWKAEAIKLAREAESASISEPKSPNQSEAPTQTSESQILKRLPSEPYKTRRKGYRTEVRGWMQRMNLGTLEQAARKLNISQATLKSIMSDKGKPRYGKEKLKAILDIINPKKVV